MSKDSKNSNNCHQWVSTCAKGLAPFLLEEVQHAGGEVLQHTPTSVIFTGPPEIAYRLCLWSRVANHVLLPFFSAEVGSADELYEAALGFSWDEILALENSFFIEVSEKSTKQSNKKYWAQKLKDGIADWFVNQHGSRPNVSKIKADVPLHLFVGDGTIELSYCFSGESLHRRGYRKESYEGSLKENLAAALLLASGWRQSSDCLLDPMCGSGTFLIEAAMIACDIAPGLNREYWGFHGWRNFDNDTWRNLVDEAQQRRQHGIAAKSCKIVGYDANKEAIAKTRQNIGFAQLDGLIHIEKKSLAFVKSIAAEGTLGDGSHRLFITNPPYGARLGDGEILRYSYKFIGELLRAEFGGWQFALLSSDIELLDQLRLPYEQHLKVFNGPLSCYFRCGKVGQADAQLVESQRYAEFIQSVFNTTSFVPTDRVSSDLANRVIKNLKKLKKWALAEDTQCFRIYDADLPEFNFSIDIYACYLHIQEYAAPKSIPEQVAQQRLDMGVETVGKLFDLAAKEMFVKTKRRQRGNSQYQKLSNQGKYYEVEEYGARILVNLSDYVDTGIFLDHRLVRKKIASLVEGKRFLNLFAYTGTATVSAALAGAKTSTTVDLSPTYIKWARKNMALNGFAEDNHYFVQQDCLTWLKKSKKQFDVIFIDPPTFSNSKRTQNVFNVQKDHVEILRLALARLEAGGIIVFSNNFRKFELDPDVHGMYQVEDITRQSIPQDFSRRPRIHQCWLLTRK